MGAQSVTRFTAAGHGDALATFLEVLEQEAEDRRSTTALLPGLLLGPAAPRIQAALRDTLETVHDLPERVVRSRDSG